MGSLVHAGTRQTIVLIEIDVHDGHRIRTLRLSDFGSITAPLADEDFFSYLADNDGATMLLHNSGAALKDN